MDHNEDWKWISKQIEKACVKECTAAPIITMIVLAIAAPIMWFAGKSQNWQEDIQPNDVIFMVIMLTLAIGVVWPILNYALKYSYMLDMCGKIAKGDYPKIYRNCSQIDCYSTADIYADGSSDHYLHFTFKDEDGVEHAVTNPIFLNKRQPAKVNPDQKVDLYYYSNEQSCLMWR